MEDTEELKELTIEHKLIELRKKINKLILKEVTLSKLMELQENRVKSLTINPDLVKNNDDN